MGRKEIDGNPVAAELLRRTPIQKWGMPGEIADAVDFLCSDTARFITRHGFRVDGGITARLGGPYPA